MRSKQAIKNTLYSIVSYSIIVSVGFISQRIFVKTLGNEYLGIHSLFSNIMTMLAIVELGFGSAIISNLYEPVAKNNFKLINQLLRFYKTVYRYVAVIVVLIGLSIMPFINIFIGNVTIDINFKVIFLFYIVDTVSSYLLSYKRSIIYAYQKSYYINIVHIVIIIFMNILQICILLYAGSYYGYLIIKIICRIIENIIINYIANRNFSFIKQKVDSGLSKEIKSDILKKVKGLLFHKIGGFAVGGTDSIIISMLPKLGVFWVGLYSNYLLITNQLSNILGQIFYSLTASIGNLIVEENYKKNYDVFKSMLLANAWIYTYVSISLYFVSKPFITVWIGEEYLFDNYIVFAITINFYLTGIRNTYAVFKDAAGIFYEDRMIPLIEAVVNLIISVIAGYFWGIIGIFIGTICSSCVLFLYSYPKFVYKKILKRTYKEYIKELLHYIILFIIIFTLCYLIMENLELNSVIGELIIKIILSFIISNVSFLLIKMKSPEFKYFYNTIKKIIKKH